MIKNYVIAWMPLPQPYKAESEDEMDDEVSDVLIEKNCKIC